MDVEVITKSRLASFGLCQRLHHLTYNLGYRSILPRPIADFGSLLHAGLEAWWLAHKDGTPLLALANAMAAMEAFRHKPEVTIDDAAWAKAELLMMAYEARWTAEMADLEVLGVEVEFIAVIPGRKRLRVAGKLDAVVRRRSADRVGFVEHKSTGADVSLGSTYWTHLRMDPQVSIYYQGMRALGHDPEFCLYDVIVRPNQKPLKATPLEKQKFTKAGVLYAKQRATDETPEEFKVRMGEAIMESPDSYFARTEVVRLESEIAASLEDVTETALQIRAGSQSGIAPRNPGGCFFYGRPCDFVGPCSGMASLDDETQFRRTEQVHEELALTSA